MGELATIVVAAVIVGGLLVGVVLAVIDAVWPPRGRPADVDLAQLGPVDEVELDRIVARESGTSGDRR